MDLASPSKWYDIIQGELGKGLALIGTALYPKAVDLELRIGSSSL